MRGKIDWAAFVLEYRDQAGASHQQQYETGDSRLHGVYCSSIEDRSKRGQITPQRPTLAANPDISNPSARFTFVY